MSATLDVVREHGVNNITLKEVASRAGVSAGAPFRHFESKDDLIAELCLEANNQIISAYSKTLEDVAPNNPQRSIERIIHAYMTWMLENPELFLILQMCHLENNIDAYGPSDVTLYRLLIEQLTKARSAGMLREGTNIQLALVSTRTLARGLANLAIDAKIGNHRSNLTDTGALEAITQHIRFLFKDSALVPSASI